MLPVHAEKAVVTALEARVLGRETCSQFAY